MKLNQSSTVGLPGFQYTLTGGSFFAPPRPWYVGPVYEVKAFLIGRTLTEEHGILDEETTHWSAFVEADRYADTKAEEGWNASLSKLDDATDPTEALAALSARVGL